VQDVTQHPARSLAATSATASPCLWPLPLNLQTPQTIHLSIPSASLDPTSAPCPPIGPFETSVLSARLVADAVGQAQHITSNALCLYIYGAAIPALQQRLLRHDHVCPPCYFGCAAERESETRGRCHWMDRSRREGGLGRVAIYISLSLCLRFPSELTCYIL